MAHNSSTDTAFALALVWPGEHASDNYLGGISQSFFFGFKIFFLFSILYHSCMMADCREKRFGRKKWRLNGG